MLHPPMRNKTRLAAHFILVLFSVGVILSITNASGLNVQSRAQKFLAVLITLKPGNATYADAQRLARQYDGRPWTALAQYKTCTPAQCYIRFEFARPRNIDRHGSQTLFAALVHFQNNYVRAIEISYECDSQSGRRAVYDVRDTLSSESSSQNRRYRWVSPGYGIAALNVDRYGTPWDVEIFLGPNATIQQRREAQRIDLSCLGESCGCYPSAVVPSGILKSLQARMASRRSERPNSK